MSARPEALCTPGIPASRAKVTLFASTFANTGAALCFRKLLDTSVWRDWNHLVPEVTIRSQPAGDEWATPFVSRNPSMAPGRDNQPRSRTETIGDVGFSRGPSLEIPPQSPKSPTSSDSPKGGKVGMGNHLNGGDPLEGRRSSSTGSPNAGGSSSVVPRSRILSISTIAGEPSVRLRVGTSMTFHVILDPSKPTKYRKTELVVSELIRPGDQPSGEKAGFRIMWESDTNLTFPHSLPKWLLFSQRVTEVRPIVRGDGKEDCEIITWECQRGLLARFVKSYYRDYLQRMFEQNVQGLRDYCEAMGGAVDRKDFSISAGM
jgi:hypothetical protein